MAAKATLWLWTLRDLACIGVGFLISILALTKMGMMLPLLITAVYAFLSIRFDNVCILDFLKYAASFFLLKPQHYEWRTRDEE